ncbi:MAG: hypothetical protein CMH98_13985 [Oceanospirillaceae bacterium]|nr:hypothetical protein [Oceanospirillaceae bacterium]
MAEYIMQIMLAIALLVCLANRYWFNRNFMDDVQGLLITPEPVQGTKLELALRYKAKNKPATVVVKKSMSSGHSPRYHLFDEHLRIDDCQQSGSVEKRLYPTIPERAAPGIWTLELTVKSYPNRWNVLYWYWPDIEEIRIPVEVASKEGFSNV